MERSPRLNNYQLWEEVKKLEGATLYTFVQGEANTIIKVEDNNDRLDKVIIKERNTTPIREDIEAAYKLMYCKESLCRDTDLNWLAQPPKLTSSIIFRIIGEIEKDFIDVDKSPPETIYLR